MAEIGQLTAGNDVVTVFSAQSQAEECILIGTVAGSLTDAYGLPVKAISVEVDGTPFIQIVGQPLVNAFAQFMQQTGSARNVSGDTEVPRPGFLFKIATGLVKKSTTYRITNAGSTTPKVYGFSTAKSGVPLLATTKTINATSYDDFDKFSALIISGVANLASAEIFFEDGGKTTMTVPELDAWFSLNNASEDGKLSGCTVIDNRGRIIKTVRLNTNSNGQVTVLKVKLPDAAFKAIVNQ